MSDEERKALDADPARLARERHATVNRQMELAAIQLLGLPTALKALTAGMAASCERPVTFVDAGWPATAPAEISVVLYRVAERTIRDATEKREASRVEVALHGTASSLRLSVSDDGMAPEPEGACGSEPDGRGDVLGEVRSRGGAVTLVESGRGRVRLEAWIPTHPASEGDASVPHA